MKKREKTKDKKKLQELKKLGLFGDGEKEDKSQNLDNLTGGVQDTTVETNWPTTSK
ncbi:hypothetical protein ACFSKL_01225 [Belliella marina]|uniref:Uncharacterized protein n=1 Tax=Belliella marina TaxID=1644146 RepID=A0ABW4VIM8_9BACT